MQNREHKTDINKLFSVLIASNFLSFLSFKSSKEVRNGELFVQGFIQYKVLEKITSVYLKHKSQIRTYWMPTMAIPKFTQPLKKVSWGHAIYENAHVYFLGIIKDCGFMANPVHIQKIQELILKHKIMLFLFSNHNYRRKTTQKGIFYSNLTVTAPLGVAPTN